MANGAPKKDGSGKGSRSNIGRGGCKTPKKSGIGKLIDKAVQRRKA